MADNNPSLPGGATPPESSKVQPKKETVRINLPPKPSAAPTIKLPTLPPGGPTAAPGSTFTPPTAAPRPAAVPAAAPSAAAAPKPAPAPRPAAPPPPPAINAIDQGLAIAAAVAGLAALGGVVYCITLFKP